MAFGKTLAHRFFNAAKSSSAGTLLPPSLRAAEPSSYLRRLLPDSSEERGLFRRFLQWRALFQSAERLPLPVGDALADRIRQLNRERLRLEGLVPPPRSPPEAKREEEERISVEEAKGTPSSLYLGSLSRYYPFRISALSRPFANLMKAAVRRR